MPKITTPIKSSLPIEYQEALKNQYLAHMRSMSGYVSSGHLEYAAQEQVRAGELMNILLTLGEKDLHSRIGKMSMALGVIFHEQSTHDRDQRYKMAIDRFVKKPLHKKGRAT